MSMTDRINKELRTFAIDPTSNGFGFVVIEGNDQLIEWGVAKVWSSGNEALVARVETFVDRYRPNLIVLEDVNETRRGKRARNRIVALARYALSKGFAIRMVSRRQVRETFRDYGLTKFEIAMAITNIFPELAPRMPRYRKPWMSEDPRMNIFDAVSFALACLS